MARTANSERRRNSEKENDREERNERDEEIVDKLVHINRVAKVVKGVSEGFKRKLEIVGVGYKAQMQGKNLKLALGFSHDVDFQVPDGISISCPSPTQVEISGIDKQKVGQIASEIRAFRPPEPYKGKGVKYEGEYILRKEGKKK